MRKFTTRIYTKANYLLNRGRMALSNQRGDFYITDAVKIIIAVVLGALLLAALTLMIRSSPASPRRLKVCSPKHQIRGQFAELLQLAPFLFLEMQMYCNGGESMNQKPCQFYSFLQAVRGNWRNALFIRCSGSLCPMIRQASCEGFLMAADAGCQPIFLSVQTVRKLSGEAVDPEECSAILECRSFRTAYSRFLEWHTSSDHVCPFLQLCPDRDTDFG